MRIATSCYVLLAILGSSGLSAFAQDKSPKPPSTTIAVPDMHCVNCAKKMASEVYKVAGVGQVLANVEATTLTVRHKENTTPSPKALWEAVERSGFDPSWLQSPSGVFKSKPKS